MTSLVRLFTAVACFCLAVSSPAEAKTIWLPVIDLGYGLHRALAFDSNLGIYNFSNIRYAAPPLAELRFRHPQPPASNYSFIDDGSVPRMCPQASPSWLTASAEWVFSYLASGTVPNDTLSYSPPNSSVLTTRDPRETEDCLFLDVIVPQSVFNTVRTKKKKIPVFVYMHGGGFTSGSKYDTDFNGLIARTQKEHRSEIVFVTINYRLGAFGFLGGPQFSKSGTPNAGLWDQRLALQWVQDNIHLFGGDKQQVTVAGGSAGAGSIVQQMTAFGGVSEPGFQKAYIESAAVLSSMSTAQEDEILADFLQLANITNLDEARSASSDLLMHANSVQVATGGYGSFSYGPTIDGVFITQDAKRSMTEGKFDKSVSVLVSHTTDEGLGFGPPIVDDAVFRALETRTFPNANQSTIDYIVNDLYPPVFNGSYGYHDEIRRGALAITESYFTCTAYSVLSAVKKSYGYVFDIPLAVHIADASYVYYNPEKNSSINSTVAYILQDYLISFVLNGTPSSSLDGLSSVPSYGEKADVVLIEANNVTNARDPAANARCEWWAQALYN